VVHDQYQQVFLLAQGGNKVCPEHAVFGKIKGLVDQLIGKVLQTCRVILVRQAVNKAELPLVLFPDKLVGLAVLLPVHGAQYFVTVYNTTKSYNQSPNI
jgi:hypothetical protein